MNALFVALKIVVIEKLKSRKIYRQAEGVVLTFVLYFFPFIFLVITILFVFFMILKKNYCFR